MIRGNCQQGELDEKVVVKCYGSVLRILFVERNYLIKMRLLFLLIISVFASENKKTKENSDPNNLENAVQNEILVKIEEDEYTKVIIHEI